jgi:uncharacterized membrane protein
MAGLPAGKRRARRMEGAEMVSPVQDPSEQETAEPEPFEPPAEQSTGRGWSWRLLANLFIAAGVNHFVMPRVYERIVPPQLRGHAKLIVQVSGVAEIAGGVGVLVPSTRRLSGLGLIALLAAVFPANLYMASEPDEFRRIPRLALYGRLPLQPLMMLWAWRATRR